MALSSSSQDDWGGGIYRGRRSPANAFYDALNALIDDEGLLFKRGGSAYYSDSDAGNTLLAVYDEFLQPGQRTVALSASHLYVLSGTTPVDVATFLAPPTARAVGVGGFLVFPTGAIAFYGGSLKTSSYTTGTVTVTNGSKTVAGSGTSWSANADAGMCLTAGTDQAIGLVASVDSDTQVTLRDAWTGATAGGATYSLSPVAVFSALLADHVAAVGTPPRLIMTKGTRAYFTGSGTPSTIDLAADYHELPQNAQILGAIGSGDSCVLFTAAGVYVIANMNLDAVDDFGNIQHTVAQVNRDLVLWGDAGVSGGGGQIIVPAIDDVFVFSPDGTAIPISAGPDGRGGWQEKIRPQYRSYVKAGYKPGFATAHRGHYLLPVLNGTTLVDVLVCRLDRGAAWTRWAGHAAGNAYAVHAGSSTTAAKLLGIAGQRITDLSSTFDPSSSNSQDADGTDFDCTIITRDYPTSPGNQPGFVQRARTKYVLEDDGSSTPTVAIAYSSDQDDDVFTTLTEKGEQGGGTGWGVSDGSLYQWALVAKKRDRIRYRITQTGAAASFILRSLEQLVRPSGKQ